MEYAEFDLTEHLGTLANGRNVLAIHGLNHTTDDADMLLVPELIAGVADMYAATDIEAKTGYMGERTSARTVSRTIVTRATRVGW
jgi:hypothetical protein